MVVALLETIYASTIKSSTAVPVGIVTDKAVPEIAVFDDVPLGETSATGSVVNFATNPSLAPLAVLS